MEQAVMMRGNKKIKENGYLCARQKGGVGVAAWPHSLRLGMR